MTLPEMQLDPDETNYFGQPDNGTYVDDDGNPVPPADQPDPPVDQPPPAADAPRVPDAQPRPQLDQDWIDRVTGRGQRRPARPQDDRPNQ